MALELRSHGRSALVGGALLVLVGHSAGQTSHTYTTTADFAQGAQFDVNATVVPDQLQLDTLGQPAPLPLVNVAASGRGTMIRIDALTGQILGEYATAPNGMATNPSRTDVDSQGNVWIGNRDENSALPGTSEFRGSAVKIGICLGGTRVNADGSPNPTGEYLKPPFIYNTCVDRNGDGLIHTSNGLGDVLAWNNITDGVGGGVSGGDARVQDADDEAILVFQRTHGLDVRFFGLLPNDDVWVGGWPLVPSGFDLLDHTTGAFLQSLVPFACGGHGGVVDAHNVLWSTDGDFATSVLRYDITANTSACLDHTAQGIGNHGLGIGPDGNVWVTIFDAGATVPIPKVLKYAPDGTMLGAFPLPTGVGLPRSVAVTPIDGNVWVDSSTTQVVVRLAPDGTVRKVIDLGADGQSPRGMAVDGNGKVWTTCFFSDTAKRIDPNGGADHLGAVDLTVSLGRNARPYNYSQMTGITPFIVFQPSGMWQVQYDSGVQSNQYGRISWHADVPATTGFTVEYRASDDPIGISSLPFTTATNGVDFTGVTGRYMDVRATFTRPQSSTLSPVLFDLTIDGLTSTGPMECPTGLRNPASLLVFPEFDNRGGDHTLLTVTNTEAYGDNVKVEFVYIGRVAPGGALLDCLEFNRTRTLTPGDTITLLTNVDNPGQEQGYVYVFAKDQYTGQAIVFNHLIGHELVLDGFASLTNSFNPYAFLGIGADGTPTDHDGDGVRDLNGIEYSCAPDVLLIPRFFGQGPGYTSNLVLINLTGGTGFTALADLLVYNDNEEVFSAQTSFQCWVKRPLLDINGAFSASFLASTNHSSTEVIGAPGLQTGWFRINGHVATSPATSIDDPALLGLLIESAAFGHSASDLPFETGAQMNGDLVLRGILGDSTP